MPISRFGAVLLAQGEYVGYMQLLRDNFSQANMETADVSQPAQYRLAGLPLRLRFQPDAGLARCPRRDRPPAISRCIC